MRVKSEWAVDREIHCLGFEFTFSKRIPLKAAGNKTSYSDGLHAKSRN